MLQKLRLITLGCLLFTTVACGSADKITAPDAEITPETDTDGDGIPDLSDNCPAEANADQDDADADGTGDACDEGDSDADGEPDLSDNCPADANADQSDVDSDDIGDVCDDVDDRTVDSDGDGFVNSDDNCPDVANADQADTDGDGTGDACDDADEDTDADGVVDTEDNCPSDSNADQADQDADDIGNVCDDDRDGDGYTEAEGDCDDTSDDYSPGLAETEDGVDNDCDGIVDEGTDSYDDDADGYSEDAGDCDDTDADVNPAESEVADEIDNDCDSAVDEGTSNNADSDDYTVTGGDCDDTDATIYPGAAETANGADDDCDGTIDEGTDAYDDDGDGYCETGCTDGTIAGDCNDDDEDVNPAATEIFNLQDDNCDGVADVDLNLGDIADEIVTVTGSSTDFDEFGSVVVSLGDINSDGYDDVAISEPKNDDNGSASGKVYVYFGSDSLSSSLSPTDADVVLLGESSGDKAGYSVASAGDVDGDGYADLLVGAPYNNAGGKADAGSAYLVYGSVMRSASSIDLSSSSVQFEGSVASDNLGISVAGGRDVNGDGCSDILIGAYNYDDSANLHYSAGKAYLFYGRGSSCYSSSTLSGTIASTSADASFVGANAYDYLGYSVAMGDMNADGNAEIILGAYGYGTYEGMVYIFKGSDTEMSGEYEVSDADASFTTSSANSYISKTLTYVGDTDGDEYGDILVSSYTTTSTGSVHIVRGSSTLTGSLSAAVTLSGEATNDNFGYSTSTIGDLDNDGSQEIIIGAYKYDDSDLDMGKVYILSPDTDTVTTADAMATLIGETEEDYVGVSVSGGGDINGDGVEDFIVGAYQANEGPGKVYVVYGAEY